MSRKKPRNVTGIFVLSRDETDGGAEGSNACAATNGVRNAGCIRSKIGVVAANPSERASNGAATAPQTPVATAFQEVSDSSDSRNEK